ncbi:hypothetical protein [Kribbella monticola]|uniref:hypothetical protein n=1 Tax=Kribbella monticola TaxID=2185285 RepID=UPI001E30B702|nr:hypothetical protein [Kribbella monticola]
MSYDVVASADKIRRSRRTLDRPSVVITSRVRHWLDLTDLTPWQPFTLAELDDRWQHHQQSLAADLGASLKVARQSGHNIPTEAPTIVAESIDEVIASARRR